MKIFNANISIDVAEFFNTKLNETTTIEMANSKMFNTCGIKNFFDNDAEFESLKEIILSYKSIVEDPDRSEYGDFQTNEALAISITTFLKGKSINPKVIVEPTCGKGSFILAALKTFENIENIFGVEIYKPYIWETKFNILQYFLNNSSAKKPEIQIFHNNVFDFDFLSISNQFRSEEILILGNPPWVTNSKLSTLQSDNLPAKSNFKKHNGLDAMTGKGNFDIGESITLLMLNTFHNYNSYLAFLVKNSVIKNIIFDQKKRNYRITDIEKYSIDSKKEFNVFVEASLFYCRLNQPASYTCLEFSFIKKTESLNRLGWTNDKFVSSIAHYQHSSDIDGICPFMWRQGVKHDLSSLMEFENVNGNFVNGKKEEVNIESDLVYGILKSSDLKEIIINKNRKFTIITQNKIGQDTSYIKKDFPRTYTYLNKHKFQFESRKSIIYKGKPDFSIFGIGDYSFKPYKIAISGLYKNYFFNLILPSNNKPLMLDDTCYFLSFDSIEFAAYTLVLLNCNKTKEFLQAITFSDAKRTFTKDILMRIDLMKISSQFSNFKIKDEINKLNNKFHLNISFDGWDDYYEIINSQPGSKIQKEQLTLFEPKEKYNRTIIPV